MPSFEPPRMPTGDDHGRRRHGSVPDELDTHDDRSIERGFSPRRWMIAAAAAVVAVLLILGLVLWGPGSPLRSPTPTPSSPVSSGPPTAPVLPESFDQYIRQSEQNSADPDDEEDVAVATSIYTRNGQPALLVIAAVPVPDLPLFLGSLGATDPARVGEGWCATYDGEPLCGVTVDETAWLVSPLTDQTEDELIRLARVLSD